VGEHEADAEVRQRGADLGSERAQLLDRLACAD
jgi:hypothetical protein